MRADFVAWLGAAWRFARQRPGVSTVSFASGAGTASCTLDLGPEGISGLCSLRGVMAGPEHRVGYPRLAFRAEDGRPVGASVEWMALGQTAFEVTFLLPLRCRTIEWTAEDPWALGTSGMLTLESFGRDATLLHLIKRRLSPLRRMIAERRRKLIKRWTTPCGDGVTQDQSGYRRYLADTEVPMERVQDEIAEHLARMTHRPMFKLTLHVAAEQVARLNPTLESVRGQVWPHWTLDIIAEPTQVSAMAELAENDGRIRLQAVVHAKGADESVQAMSDPRTAAFVGCIEAGARLHPFALYLLACEGDEHPACDLLYCDEDTLDVHGIRKWPVLKSGWNRELLYSGNYLGHLSLFREERVAQCGGWRAGTSAAEDYEFVLRFTRDIQPHQVRHVAAILYHRHQSESPAGVLLALAEVLRRHLDGKAASVQAVISLGLLRVRPGLPQPQPRVSVIVPTRDGGDHLRTCIESLFERTRYPEFELLLVDNQSQDPATLAYLAELSGLARARVLHYDAPFNFAAIINLAEAAATGSVLALLNDDTEILSPEWLSEMVAHACQPDVGAVGAKLYYPDGTIQHAGLGLGIGSVAGHLHLGAPGAAEGYLGRLHRTQAVGAVTGACLVVDREKFRDVGGMDAVNLHVAFNDVDLCLKLAQKGWHSVWTPVAELVHHESKSRGADTSAEKRALFLREHQYMRLRWGALLEADSYYHPHLTRSNLDLRFHRSPRRCRPWMQGQPAGPATGDEDTTA